MKLRLVSLTVFILLLSASNSFAFLRWVRELSGPGQFFGVTLFNSFPLFAKTPNLDDLSHLELLSIKEIFDIDVPLTPEKIEDVSPLFRREAAGFYGFDVVGAVETLAKEKKDRGAPEWKQLANRIGTEETGASAETLYSTIRRNVRAQSERRIRDAVRSVSGQTGLGFFGVKRPIPGYLKPKEDGGDTGRVNFFFNLSFDAKASLRNSLSYAASDTRNKTVWWFSATPSFEVRAPILGQHRAIEIDHDRNKENDATFSKHPDVYVFANSGLGIDWFIGDAFPAFVKFPWRSRAGVGFHNIQAGVEVLYFFNRFNPGDFGALGGTEGGGETVLGFFIGFDVLNR